MIFKPGLNLKFYIVSIILLGFSAFGWYSTYFLNANEILMEDNTPMTRETKIFFTVLLCLILFTWTFSAISVIVQAMRGYGFCMDENGIHNTVTAMLILSVILVIPVKNIPYSAIEKITKEEDVITLHLDKSKIKVSPFLRPFISKKYRLFSGFTKEKQAEAEEHLRRFIKEKIPN